MSVLDKLRTTRSEHAPAGPHFDPRKAAEGDRPAPATANGTQRATVTGALLAAKNIVKSYKKGKVEVPVLRGVDFAIQPGRFTAIVGASGCGKSTLLHLLGTLDAPDSGQIHFKGQRIDNL